jgi:hypothetical protein
MPGFGFGIANSPTEPEDIPTPVIEATLEQPEFTAGARLCNFPTAKATLRPEHAEWIKTKIEPLLKPGGTTSFALTAHASARGSDSKNHSISQNRLEAVKAYIEARAELKHATVKFRKLEAKGEDEARDFKLPEKSNSGFYRAVEVLHFRTKEPPVVIRPPRLKAFGSQDFHIAFSKGGSGSVGPFQAEVLLFVIVDTHDRKNMTAAHFLYAGRGFTLSIPKIPGSVSGMGRFSKLKTTKPVFLRSFEGPADVTQPPQVQVGDKSLNSVLNLSFYSFEMKKNNAAVIPNPRSIETGSGLGASLGSITDAVLTMVGAPFKFTGPIVAAPL